ncbi:hypothetical protein C2E20_1429 [Micractinium conductrix]|uniref:Uncharacterized protein n=1 Tax=Micractinium conductrix TaxID=554055 RepID=A0A2P6VN54_9CHLO|nr:hypothetical protein C2E20_1429 [Micractinium conductrix]|eukprot:PSC75487.1 hypothetical protein C2E20_1429 [Micractinium conductrix]
MVEPQLTGPRHGGARIKPGRPPKLTAKSRFFLVLCRMHTNTEPQAGSCLLHSPILRARTTGTHEPWWTHRCSAAVPGVVLDRTPPPARPGLRHGQGLQLSACPGAHMELV